MFYEIEAPREMSFGSAGGRGWSTTINEGFSGWRQFNQNWQYPLGDWTITIKSQQNPSPAVTITDYDVFFAFWVNMKGPANGFRFWAPGDNTASGTYVATADGTSTTYQLAKTYQIYASSFTIPIKKPITSAIHDYKGNPLTPDVPFQIYVNGTPTSTTLDPTSGLFTFSSPPASGAVITADFQFHFPVHFKDDKWNGQVEKSYVRGNQMIVNVASQPIIEVRL